jgi:hypothetical protein
MSAAQARTLSVCLVLLLTLATGVALAQRIVLLRPRASDPALSAAFAHLTGELTVHHFEVVVLDTSDDAAPDELEQVAEQHQAVAAIALLRSRDAASADIWISDRITGKTTRRTVTTAPRPEAPNVLAVRAVELLRASLREFGAAPRPPPDIVGASPARAPERTLDWASEPVQAFPRFAVEAGMVVQLPSARFSAAYGPALALGYDPLPRLALRVLFQGPLRRSRHVAERAAVSLVQQQLMAEVRYRFWSHQELSCLLLVDLGAQHLAVQGQASRPYVAESDTAWTALVGAGLALEWQFVRAAALSLRSRSLMLAPRPVLNVAEEHVAFGRPLLQVAGGIDVSF